MLDDLVRGRAARRRQDDPGARHILMLVLSSPIRTTLGDCRQRQQYTVSPVAPEVFTDYLF